MSEIPYYEDYQSLKLRKSLLQKATPVPGVSGLVQVGKNSGLETTEALGFLVELYNETKSHLAEVLKQRIKDRKFIDERVKSCAKLNQELNKNVGDHDYQTILGLEDSDGRIIIGPKTENYCNEGTC